MCTKPFDIVFNTDGRGKPWENCNYHNHALTTGTKLTSNEWTNPEQTADRVSPDNIISFFGNNDNGGYTYNLGNIRDQINADPHCW